MGMDASRLKEGQGLKWTKDVEAIRRKQASEVKAN